ncbi:ammonium transporter AmtB-like domain-containing protein [Yarrowia lipolytica]|jgi:Amt family ammonium transporter|nr:ammonium transporter AmtB-like domain-containing protein [Yarrowia lipolytica]KAE8169891.1 ammonium transporter AmtB-like domain-containing protein [Yarrowia lipolytica]QNP95043.1 Ammonium transporter 2 [Yarrowia lipolytica]RDW36070.1 ammonium transporter AmtB-like domain-containing protein [Yarrowia lipolytica]RMI96956.1 ammonium transporter AmtB-like domain-containing protein [Yarrowia lipolytica]
MEAYHPGDLLSVIHSTMAMMLMCPALGMLYSGLTPHSSALSMAGMNLAALSMAVLQWVVWGYSLALSPTGGKFMGNLRHAGFHHVALEPHPIAFGRLPGLAVAMFEGMFLCITAVIMTGSIVGRGRVVPFVVFIFCWATVVYCPIACWVWGPNGWSGNLGALDFAGGSPVHINSGFTGLAYGIMLRWSRGRKMGQTPVAVPEPHYPHSAMLVMIGTGLLWTGWLGFASGGAFGANLMALMASSNTMIGGAFGGLAWAVLDYRIERKLSMIGFCSGAVSGLVSLSPSSGYVAPWAAIVCAIVGSIACNLATQLKFFIHVEDPLDVFAIHGIGGMVGSLLVGLFAEKEVAKLDGNRDIKGGWVNQHYAQLGYQCAEVFSVAGYAFFVSLVLLFIIDRIPGLHLRMDPEAESQGPDTNQHGEVCYEFLAQLGDDPSPNHPDTDPSNTINGSSPRPSMDGNQFGIYELHAIQSKKVNDAYHFPMHPPMQVNFPPPVSQPQPPSQDATPPPHNEPPPTPMLDFSLGPQQPPRQPLNRTVTSPLLGE